MEPDDTPPTRRLILRRQRAGGGFSAGSSSRSESLRAPEEHHDEVDQAIDPDEASRAIRQGSIPEGGQITPAQRLQQVQSAGSSAYTREYRMQLIHRYLMQGVPLDQIATQLRVSISTVEKDRAALKKHLREQAKQMDVNELIGSQSALYDEISSMALRVSASGNTPTAMRLAAMRTSLAANADRTRFLQSAGVFDVLRFRQQENGDTQSDIQLLMSRTAAALAALDSDEPNPGFKPMSFNDADSSSGDSEFMEL